jgi:hypothetical protein
MGMLNRHESVENASASTSCLMNTTIARSVEVSCRLEEPETYLDLVNDLHSPVQDDTAICILVSQLAKHVLFCLKELEVGTLVMAYNAFNMH